MLFEVGKSYKCMYRQIDVGWVTTTANVIKRTAKTITIDVVDAAKYNGACRTYIDPMGNERSESYGFLMIAE